MKKSFILIFSLPLILWLSISIETAIILEFSAYNDRDDSGSFYYDIGLGFNEKDKISFNYRNENITLLIREDRIKSLRFDPSTGDSLTTIKNLKVNNKSILTEQLVLQAINHIEEIRKTSPSEFKIVAKGSDPYLILEDNIESKINSFEINYSTLFLYLLFLLPILFKGKIAIRKAINIYHSIKISSSIKLFLVLFLSFSSFFMLIGYLFQLDYGIKSSTFSSIYIFIEPYLSEFLAVLLITLLLVKKYKILASMGVLLVACYSIINMAQFISFVISGEFMTRLALDNAESINLLLTFENISIVAISIFLLVIFPLLISLLITKYLNLTFNKNIIYIIFILLLINQSIYFLYPPIQNSSQSLYQLNYIDKFSPIESFIKIHLPQKLKKDFKFSRTEINQLKELGFTISPYADYPLMKNEIYKSKSPFNRRISKPNIILLLTEGFSSRTSNLYNDKYEDLTPNIKNFANNQNTLFIDNYFNHTAATYRGIAGQLCSIYPKYGGVGGWNDGGSQILKTNYKCLPHVLANNGYNNIYLNMLYKDYSGIDEMVSNFGFDKIISGEELSIKYLQGINKIRGDRFTDHQSYQTLINYLKGIKSNSPFFISLYTSETHAWLNTKSDGKQYKNGKNNSLNTIYNMDHAFGNFWDYFKSSKYAQNTIIIFTSDHAHYYEKSYVKLMKQYKEKDYKKLFIDQIPLLIYDPTTSSTIRRFDANSATTIDLAPTIIHYLNLPNEKNSFSGNSIFERQGNIGVANYGFESYIVKNKTVYSKRDIPAKDKSILELVDKYIQYMKELETSNRLYKN